MKKNIFIILFLHLSLLNVAQKQPCEDLSDSVKKVTLNNAKLMSELIANYPLEYYNTIINYVSIEISGTCSGKKVTAISNTETLTIEQKNILAKVDTGSKIFIKIKFTYKDSKNDDLGSDRKIKEMDYKVKASTLPSTGLPPCGC